MARAQRDPVWWVRTVLGVDPWSKQEDILVSVRDHGRTAVRSAHGLGKTFVAACVALWWLYSHPASIVITTAPTWPQVENLLWREIRRLHGGARVPLGGKVLTTSLELGEKWYALGLSTNEPERFQGFHAEHLLLIVDEASGVDQGIFDASEGFLTGPHARVLLIGNPTQVRGEFYDAFKSPLYQKLALSAFESPNVVEQRLVRPYLTTAEWIEDKRVKWGAGTPLWQSRVLGEFPDQSEDMVFPLSWVEQAQARTPSRGGPVIFGVDVARFGTDASVLAVRQGDDIGALEAHHQWDTTAVAGWIAQAAQHWHPQTIRVDADGLGAGVYDLLKAQGYPVVEIHSGQAARDSEQFLNRRAEWYWGLRERLDPQGPAPMALPRDDDLLAQLTSIHYKFTARGQIQLESKDDLRKQGLPSPDCADAVVYAMAAVQGRSAVIGATGTATVPQWVQGVQSAARVPVVAGHGQLPLPVTVGGRAPPQRGTCPQCGTLLTRHNSAGQWWCPEHGWSERRR
jgi:hypothetical protein